MSSPTSYPSTTDEGVVSLIIFVSPLPRPVSGKQQQQHQHTLHIHNSLVNNTTWTATTTTATTIPLLFSYLKTLPVSLFLNRIIFRSPILGKKKQFQMFFFSFIFCFTAPFFIRECACVNVTLQHQQQQKKKNLKIPFGFFFLSLSTPPPPPLETSYQCVQCCCEIKKQLNVQNFLEITAVMMCSGMGEKEREKKRPIGGIICGTGSFFSEIGKKKEKRMKFFSLFFDRVKGKEVGEFVNLGWSIFSFKSSSIFVVFFLQT